MLDRTAQQFDLTPSRLVADGGYGSADMIEWLVDERGIEPHVKLMDKSERTDRTFSRSDFAYDPDRNLYVCPGGKELGNTTPLSPSQPPGLDEGKNADLLRQQARLRGLRAQAHMLPERTRTQDRALGPRSCSRQGARNCKDRGLRCLTPPTKEG